MEHELTHALLPARHNATVGAAAFLGVPIDDVGAGEDFGTGLHIDLALLLGLHLGDMVEALAQQIGGLAHDLGAVIGRGCLPQRKAFFRGGQRSVEIGFAGVRQTRQRLASRRIDDILAFAAVAVEPFAIDEKTKLAIHVTLVVTRNISSRDALALSRACGHSSAALQHERFSLRNQPRWRGLRMEWAAARAAGRLARP